MERYLALSERAARVILDAHQGESHFAGFPLSRRDRVLLRDYFKHLLVKTFTKSLAWPIRLMRVGVDEASHG